MKNTRGLLILLLLLFGFQPGAPAQEGQSFTLIVNPSNPLATADRSAVSRLFLKKVTRWDDGTPVVPVDQPVGSDVRDRFSQAVHGRSAANIEAYWQRRIFSGRDLPPPKMGSDEAVLAFVSQNPGAVGYVSSRASLTGVKAVRVEDD